MSDDRCTCDDCTGVTARRENEELRKRLAASEDRLARLLAAIDDHCRDYPECSWHVDDEGEP